MSRDLACFTKVDQSELYGIIEAYFDDRIATGNENLEKESQFIERVFDSKATHIKFIYLSRNFNQERRFQVCITSKQLPKYLQELPYDSTVDTFRIQRHELAWLNCTRPDICLSVA